MRVGVISDTHSLLRPEALSALRGTDYILHAGDVGDPHILAALREIAPLTAIRGNIDRAGPCALLPAREAIELGGTLIYMVHSIEDLDIKPHAANVGVIVYGHSHKPNLDMRNGVLYLNPGSAGPRRFSLPITLAILTLGSEAPAAELLTLCI